MQINQRLFKITINEKAKVNSRAGGEKLHEPV